MKIEMATTTDKQSLVKPEHYVYSHITKIQGVCGGSGAFQPILGSALSRSSHSFREGTAPTSPSSPRFISMA